MTSLTHLAFGEHLWRVQEEKEGQYPLWVPNVDGPEVLKLTVNSCKDQCQNKYQTRIRTLILIISTSFGESLFLGSHVCIWGKTVLKQREKDTSECSTRARELEGLHPKAS